MKKDVGANLAGELAGFPSEQARVLVSARSAEVVCEFNPETHVFDPKTEQLTEIQPGEVPPEPAREEVTQLEAENSVLRDRVAELERDLAIAVDLHASAVVEAEKLKADLVAAESLLSATPAPATTVEEPPKS